MVGFADPPGQGRKSWAKSWESFDRAEDRPLADGAVDDGVRHSQL